jgi:membrane associated rhomboid family serine protease
MREASFEERDLHLTGQGKDILIEVHLSATRSDAEEHALVLLAMGIGCTVVEDDSVFALLVSAPNAMSAREQLALYAEENREPAHPRPSERRLADGIGGALVYGAVLLLLYVWSHQYTFSQDWWIAGAAQARLIIDGEWWRTVTALGLHADPVHLASNVTFGVWFGLLVSQVLGSGLAWLAILAAGAAGNALNAVVQPATHTAVGASTSVFAAIGILSGLMLRRQAYHWRRGVRRWTPLAGGLMLLAYLGIGGERTDVGAHLAGFASGSIVGIASAYMGHWLPQGPLAQRAFGISTLVIVSLAWVLALHAHG